MQNCSSIYKASLLFIFVDYIVKCCCWYNIENRKMGISEKTYRFGKTTFTYIGFLVLGLAMSLGGPSVPDMCERLGVNTDELSLAFSMQSIMWTVGAIIFGPIIDRFQGHCDVFLAVSMFLMGFMCVLKPFSPYLWVFVTAASFEALAYAGIDLSSNAMMFSTWGEKANAPVQGLHTAWGVGFAFGPLIIRPFLGPDQDDGSVYNVTTVSPATESTTSPSEVQESRIEIAYAFTAAFAFALGVMALVIFKAGVPKGVTLHLKPKNSFKEVFSLQSYAAGDRTFAIKILIVFTLFYFANAGREGVFSTWLFNYAIESELDFSKQEAALLDAAAKFSFLGGRIIATLLALKIAIQPMLITEVYAVMGLVLCLWGWGTSDKVFLWVFSCLVNAFSAPIWPGGLTWTDRYIVVGGVVFTIMNLGAGAAGLFFHWFTGWLFTYRSADAIMYVLIFCSVMLCVMMVIMQIIGSRHGERFSRIVETKEIDKDSDLTTAVCFEKSNNGFADSMPDKMESSWL